MICVRESRDRSLRPQQSQYSAVSPVRGLADDELYSTVAPGGGAHKKRGEVMGCCKEEKNETCTRFTATKSVSFNTLW